MYLLTFNFLCRRSLTFLLAFFTHMIPVEIALGSVSCRNKKGNRCCKFTLSIVIWISRIYRDCLQTPCSEAVVFQYFALLRMFLGVNL